ncbi:MAG: hypothetical protein AAF409_19105 [Pseudomonadota bacterium]
MISRRALVMAGGAWAVAQAASAHTLYPQWLAYRRKHLLIGSHRKDNATYLLAEELVAHINHVLPKANARAARAPHPERLASLIGTDQMEVAVLGRAEAAKMKAGVGRFAPYGEIALSRLADFGPYTLVAEASFPTRHAWMISAAIDDSALSQSIEGSAVLPLHAGVEAYRTGIALKELDDA